MAVMINLARLVATCRQPKPGANGARCSKVRWILDRRDIRHRSDRANARDRHQQLSGLALPRACEQLAIKIGGMCADVAPCFEQRQDYPRQPGPSVEKLPDIAI